MSTSKGAKYRDTDGKWGCLGCGFTLYPNGAEVDYCANVRCLLRHPHAAGSKDVCRLVKQVVEVRSNLDTAVRLLRESFKSQRAEAWLAAYDARMPKA